MASSEQKGDGRDYVDEILKLSVLKDDAKAELIEVFESLRGRKAFLVDGLLSNIINQIVPEASSFWTEHGVVLTRDISTDSNSIVGDCCREAADNYIYFVRPHLPTMRVVAHQIKSMADFGLRSQFKVYFVPSQSTVCMHILEEHINDFDVWERITFKEFRSGFVPMDSDLLTLDMDYVFKQCYVDGDLSCLNIIADAIGRLQSAYGIIPHVKSKGVGAKKVLQRLMHKRVDDESYAEADGGGSRQQDLGSKHEIDTLIVLDRELDFVSPLVTPLTYEGLVDEVLGIVNGKIRIEASLLGNEDAPDFSQMKLPSGTVVASEQKKAAPGEKVTLQLDNSDSIFAEIRNLSIERIGAFMQEKAIHIRERYAAFKGNKDASLAEIHDFVKKIPKLTKDFKSLNQHIHIAELLKQRTDSREFRDLWQGERSMLEGESFMDQIEEMILSDVNQSQLSTILKLLCMQSITAGGIRGNRYDALRRSIVQTYGFQHLYTLNNLERCGMIRRKDAIIMVESSSQWNILKKQFRVGGRLIDDRVNMSKPDDISYVAAGYAPLLIRVVQMITNIPAQGGIVESLKLLPGPYLDFTQPQEAEELVDILSRSSTDSAPLSSLQSVLNIGADLAATTKGAFRKDVDDTRFLPNVLMDDSSTEKKVMVLVVIGGLSPIELAAVRYLSTDPSFPFRIVVATTKLINSQNLVGSMLQDF